MNLISHFKYFRLECDRIKSMDFFFLNRGEKCGQATHVGIGGWDRLEEAQTIGREIGSL